MSAIPASGSLQAKNEFYRRRLSSASSISSTNSSGALDHTWECHHPHPALPTVDSSHWWMNFFFHKPNTQQLASSPLCDAMESTDLLKKHVSLVKVSDDKV